MIALAIDQRSQEWVAARRGIPTASNFDKIVTITGELSKQAQKYLWQLAGERACGQSEDGYVNAAMERGAELECEARQFYELVNDCVIDPVGICYPDESKRYACSPDGLVADEGLVEFKCPGVATHVGYLVAGTFPSEYTQQVQGQLLVTGRKWCDFVSYYPGLKPLVIRVNRDEAFITKLKNALEKFCDDLDRLTERISA